MNDFQIGLDCFTMVRLKYIVPFWFHVLSNISFASIILHFSKASRIEPRVAFLPSIFCHFLKTYQALISTLVVSAFLCSFSMSWGLRPSARNKFCKSSEPSSCVTSWKWHSAMSVMYMIKRKHVLNASLRSFQDF